MRRPTPRLTAGFTLVEVLVALAVMAIMAALAWQGIAGIARSRELNGERLDRTLRLQTVIAQWEQDLAALQDSRVVPPLGFDGGTLRLSRAGPEGMQMVAWTLRNGAWWRWAAPPTATAGGLQQQWLASQQLLGNEPGHVKLLDGVPRWQVYCFRNNAWTNCQSSDDVVDGEPEPPGPGASAPQRRTPRAALPSGLRLVLTLGGDDTAPSITRDVQLPPLQR